MSWLVESFLKIRSSRGLEALLEETLSTLWQGSVWSWDLSTLAVLLCDDSQWLWQPYGWNSQLPRILTSKKRCLTSSLSLTIKVWHLGILCIPTFFSHGTHQYQLEIAVPSHCHQHECHDVVSMQGAHMHLIFEHWNYWYFYWRCWRHLGLIVDQLLRWDAGP